VILLIAITKIIAKLRFYTPAYLHYWMGSTFRGAMGYQLKKLCCVDTRTNCQSCNLSEDCMFYNIYMRKTAKKGYTAPLKPIIFIPQFIGKSLTLLKNGEMTVEIIFFGNYSRYLPHIISGIKLLGLSGIGNPRYKNSNLFYIESMKCGFSGRDILEGDILLKQNVSQLDAADIPLYQEPELYLGFRSPLTTSQFPPTLESLIKGIRQRLIFLCNEYGSGELIPDFRWAKGSIVDYESHLHRLERRSARIGKHKLKGYTGTILYHFTEIDDIARWFLNIGFIIGCGSNISFGCGFLQNLRDSSLCDSKIMNSSRFSGDLE